VVVETRLLREERVGEARELFGGAGDGLLAVLDARECLRFESEKLAVFGGLLAQALAQKAHLSTCEIRLRDDQVARDYAHYLFRRWNLRDRSPIGIREVLDSH
jgi:hypothetical protein